MKTIDVTFSTPAVAAVVARALRFAAASREFSTSAYTLLDTAVAIETARARVVGAFTPYRKEKL